MANTAGLQHELTAADRHDRKGRFLIAPVPPKNDLLVQRACFQKLVAGVEAAACHLLLLSVVSISMPWGIVYDESGM